MRFPAAILAVPLLCLSSAVRAESGPEVAAAVAGKRLSERTLRLSAEKPLSFETGAASYVLAVGTLTEVVTAAGTPIGFFFRGHGSLRWKRLPSLLQAGAAAAPGDELARQIGKFLKLEERAAEFRFQTASFLTGGMKVLEGDPRWNQEKPSAETLDRHLKKFESPFLPPVDPSLAVSLLEKDRSFFAAHLEGKRTLVHHEDGVFSGEAGLWVVAPGAPPVALDAWSTTDRPGFLLTSVELDIRELERSYGLGLFRIVERIRLEEPSGVLVFSLLSDPPFTPSSVYFDSLSEQKLGDLPYLLKSGRLFVFLPSRQPSETVLELTMRYQGGLVSRYESDRLGWELPGHQPWYPRPAKWEKVAAAFRGTLRSRRPSVPMAPGEEVRRWVDGAWNALEFRVPESRPSLSLLAGCYGGGTREPAGDSTAVFPWLSGSPEPPNAASPRVVVHGFCGPVDPWETATVDLVTRVSLAAAEISGLPLPAEYRVVERDGTPEVMDSQNWGLTSGNLVAARKSTSFSEAFRLTGRLVQASWFEAVRPRRRQDTWVLVALSNITALEALEKVAPQAKPGGVVEAARERSRRLISELRKTPATLLSEMEDPELKTEIKARVKAAATLGPDAPDGLNAPRTPLVRGHALASHALGLVLMDAIRTRMGLEKFRAFLKAFYAERRESGDVGTEDLIDALSRSTGEDWYPWFERFVYANKIPEAMPPKAVTPIAGSGQP